MKLRIKAKKEVKIETRKLVDFNKPDGEKSKKDLTDLSLEKEEEKIGGNQEKKYMSLGRILDKKREENKRIFTT